MTKQLQERLNAEQARLDAAVDAALTPEAVKMRKKAHDLSDAADKARAIADAASKVAREFSQSQDYVNALHAADAPIAARALFMRARGFIGLAQAIDSVFLPAGASVLTHLQLAAAAKVYPDIASALLTVHPQDDDPKKVGKITGKWWNGESNVGGARSEVEAARIILKGLPTV